MSVDLFGFVAAPMRRPNKRLEASALAERDRIRTPVLSLSESGQIGITDGRKIRTAVSYYHIAIASATLCRRSTSPSLPGASSKKSRLIPLEKMGGPSLTPCFDYSNKIMGATGPVHNPLIP
jgi:hypothetical protein